jgi:hypothetical protein
MKAGGIIRVFVQQGFCKGIGVYGVYDFPVIGYCDQIDHFGIWYEMPTGMEVGAAIVCKANCGFAFVAFVDIGIYGEAGIQGDQCCKYHEGNIGVEG